MTIFIEKGITHLDLHGVKHLDVDNEVKNFVFQISNKERVVLISQL